MTIEFARAITNAQIESVQRLRFDVYVDEMGRYDGVDGADDGRFAEPEDEHSWLFYARDGDEIVAATRMTGEVAGSRSARWSSTSSSRSLPSSRPK